MDPKMLKELNQQIQEETYSSYIYLAMAADQESNGFKGMATWMQVQAREEKIHADIFLNYILERGERVELAAIQKDVFLRARDPRDRGTRTHRGPP